MGMFIIYGTQLLVGTCNQRCDLAMGNDVPKMS